MVTIKDIKDKIEEIRNTEFEVGEYSNNIFRCDEEKYNIIRHKVINIFRSALLCNFSIQQLSYESEKIAKELHQELDEVIKSKLREIRPDFDETTLNRITQTYKSSVVVYPFDVIVLDDVIFSKIGIFNDNSSIYRIEVYMQGGTKPFYDIFDYDFIASDYYLHWHELSSIVLDSKDEMQATDLIINNINTLYNEKILWTDDGISIRGKIDTQKIFLDMKYNEIGRNIRDKKECDLRLCIQNGEDITLYYIHQSYKDDKPIWNIISVNNEPWRLTDAVLNQKKMKLQSQENK